ncbi:hypothetical protein [Vannielia litorea]|uniref:hypothetical protein n=1 Tax=Vannielia litorea TaxID=1217970 RepID=UPI001BD1113A|nr:hypothetical protein [Vannielia litorea]
MERFPFVVSIKYYFIIFGNGVCHGGVRNFIYPNNSNHYDALLMLPPRRGQRESQVTQ